MRKLLLFIAAFFMLALAARAQESESFGNFRLVSMVGNNSLVWQKIYAHDFESIEDVSQALFERGMIFKDIVVLDSTTVTCTAHFFFNYRNAGYERNQMPIVILNSDELYCRFVFQLKPDRMRVTADRIYLPKNRSDSFLTSEPDMRSFVDAAGRIFQDKIMLRALDMLDKNIQFALDFRTPGYLADNF